MSTLDHALRSLRTFDDISRTDNALKRFDPRALVLVTVVYAGVVVSFGGQTLGALAPFVLFALGMSYASGAPPWFLLRRVLMALPFAALLGAANLWLDTKTVLYVGAYPVTGGMVSFASILLRFVLTAWAALALAAGLGMARVCRGLSGLCAPRAFVVQLLMLHRFAFVLAEEASRMSRARQLRSFQGRGMGVGVYAQMVGQLLLRSLDRARRVHTAMLCRGFTGEMPLGEPGRWRVRDTILVVCLGCALYAARVNDVSVLIGRVVLGVLG